MRRVLAGGLLLVLATAFSVSSDDVVPQSPTLTDLVGIWKMSFEPDLRGLSEPDGGYLVLMPDFRFYRVQEGCCREGHEPPITGESGTFAIEGDTIVLFGKSRDGKPYESRYRYRQSAAVVLFDDLRGGPTELPILQVGATLNYGYAKVFWRERWRKR